MKEAEPSQNMPTESQEAEGKNQISVKVCDAHGNEVYFKIKKTTQLRKLKAAYCKRQGLQKEQVRFTFDGHRIADDETAEILDIDDNDVIDAMVEQIGGYHL
mmetsp:Transcript_2462/g.3588  ORF Transcript_2462/g.3588 Transcript_2462/m.3588 type:complete len:102 (-) Transcript_2462:1089-1394(-)